MKQSAPFYLFMLMVVFSPLAIDIFLPAIPAMSVALDAEMHSVQALVGIFILSMGAGQLLAGPLADRYGRRPVALAGIAIYIASALMGALAGSVEMLWVSRLLQGLGTCELKNLDGLRTTNLLLDLWSLAHPYASTSSHSPCPCWAHYHPPEI